MLTRINLKSFTASCINMEMHICQQTNPNACVLYRVGVLPEDDPHVVETCRSWMKVLVF